jgi:hypothetical protein
MLTVCDRKGVSLVSADGGQRESTLRENAVP